MADPKCVKIAARHFGDLKKAEGTVLEESGTKIVQVSLSDIHGNVADSEDNNDLFYWLVTVQPSEKTLYHNHTYSLHFSLSSTAFPHKPPVVCVKSPIYNPLVDPNDGSICEKLVEGPDGWKPSMKPVTILTNVCKGIFLEFSSLPPLNNEAAKLLNEDKAAFEKKAREGPDAS